MAIRVKFGWLEPLGRLGQLGSIRQTKQHIMHCALCNMHLKGESEFNDCDSCAAELDMFVMEFLHARHCSQVLTD